MLRPQNNYSGPQTQTPLVCRGQHARPQYAHGHFTQAANAAGHGYAHTSIEASTSPTMFSIPRTGSNEYVYDTCSTSDSSRESSAYPRAPAPSTSTTKPRSTRAKRGSESQGSSDDRKAKRPSTNDSEIWCTDCECPFDDCSNPKTHKTKGKKILKEKHARGEHATILQNFEDMVQNVVHCEGKKLQQPGNKKKSGCNIQKKEIFVSTDILLDEAMWTIASLGRDPWKAFTERARRRVEAYDPDSCPTALPPGSLMADASGNDVCPHNARNQACQEPIECRKHRRAVNFPRNLERIMRSGQAGNIARTPSERSSRSSKSSTPKRH